MKEQVKEQVLDAKRLFYFSEVFKRGSLNAVADRLDMAQAGIGRQIQLLEKELGVPLFERGTNGRGMVPGGHGRGMVPTEAAQLVYDYYRKNRDDQEKLKVALQEMRQMKRGSICIATLSAYVDPLMEEVLSDFYHKHPSLNVQIKEVDSASRIMKGVLDDDVHMGIARAYPEHLNNPDIRCCARGSIPLCMLVNQHHPLSHKKRGELMEIAPYPLVLSSFSYVAQRALKSVERTEEIRLAPRFIVDSFIARKKAAITGCAGTFMSAFSVRQEIESGQLTTFEIDHPAFTSMEAGLIVRRGRLLSPAANQLLRLIAGKFSLFSIQKREPIQAPEAIFPSLGETTP